MSKKKPAYVDGKFVGDTLSISVKPHYQKEYEFLKSHHNRSGLICELVRQYLEGGAMPIGYQVPSQPVVKQENVVERVEPKIEEKPKTEEEVKEKVEKKESPKREQKNKSAEVPVMSMPSFM